MNGRGSPEGAGLASRDNLKGAGFMLLAMAAFTIGDSLMKQVSQMMPLYQAVALRGLLTLPLLLLLGKVSGGLHFDRIWRERKLTGLRTFAEVASTVTFFLGLVALPLAIVTAILQATPLAVTAAAAFFLGEKVGLPRFLAICAGFCGVLIIIRPGSDGFGLPTVFVLISVCFVVLRDLSTRRLPKDIPSASVAFLAAAGVLLVSLVISAREPWGEVPVAAIPMLCGAALAVVTGYISVIRSMRTGDVSFVTPFRYSALLWALMLSWVISGYFPDALTLFGAAVVVASGIFTLWREGRRNRAAARG
ncbi:DMT family transporter [Falsigemmobacter faecalis]|nr:DMT family transporter [Falsigemmobacter faecalis]